MSSADDVRRWSEELARNPSSVVFLRLAEALREQGQLTLAMNVATRGLARHSTNVEAKALVLRIASELTRADAAGTTGPEEASAPPAGDTFRAERPDRAGSDAQTLLVDSQGLVLDGAYTDGGGRDASQEVAAQLSGISDEASRAARYLGLGQWKAILVETDSTAIGIAPIGADAIALVAAPRSMPLGMLRRRLARSADRGVRLLAGGDGE